MLENYSSKTCFLNNIITKPRDLCCHVKSEKFSKLNQSEWRTQGRLLTETSGSSAEGRADKSGRIEGPLREQLWAEWEGV